jgi:hypothetical protein
MAVIYALTCIATNKSYIGCTKGKPAKRFREHRCLLNAKQHSCKEMQTDWDAFGNEGFRLEILQDLGDNPSVGRKRNCELSWMDRLDAEGRLYDQSRISFAPTPEATAKGVEASRHVPGNRWTAEANRKRSEAQKGIPKGHGAKISATKQARKAALLAR